MYAITDIQCLILVSQYFSAMWWLIQVLCILVSFFLSEVQNSTAQSTDDFENWKKNKHTTNNFSFNHVLQSTQNILQLGVLHNIMSMSYALYYPNCY